MENIDTQTKILKTIKMTIGLLIMSLGTVILFDIGSGSAPAPTIIEGVAIFFNMNYGIAAFSINMVFLLLLIFLDKNLIGLGTIIATLFLGYFIDLGTYVLAPLKIAQMGLYMQVVMMIIGSILNGIGLGYYVGQFYGTGAMDAISLVINERTNIEFKYCRWIMDTIIMIIGVLLGASWGIGTVVSILLTGPIMQFVIDKIKENELPEKI